MTFPSFHYKGLYVLYVSTRLRSVTRHNGSISYNRLARHSMQTHLMTPRPARPIPQVKVSACHRADVVYWALARNFDRFTSENQEFSVAICIAHPLSYRKVYTGPVTGGQLVTAFTASCIDRMNGWMNEWPNWVHMWKYLYDDLHICSVLCKAC